MDMLVNIPREIIGYIENKKSIFESTLLLSTYVRGRVPKNCDIYLFADESCLYVLEAVFEINGDLDRVVRETGFVSYSLDEIKDFSIEEFASGIRAIVELENTDRFILCEADNTYKQPTNLFFEYVRLIKAGEFTKVDPKDIDSRCPKCHRVYPDERKSCPLCSGNSGVVKKLMPFFKRYIKEMLAVLLLMALISALGLLSPYISNSFYIEKVLTEGGELYGDILFVITLLVSLRIANFAVTILNDIVTARISANITYDLKNTIFKAINRLSLSFFNSRRTGGLMTQIESDSNTLYSFFSEMVPNILVAVVKIAAVVIVMLFMNPTLALVTIAVVPVYVLLIEKAFYKSRTYARNVFVKARKVNGILTDVLGGLRVVKAFAKEKDESENFHNLTSDRMETLRRWQMHQAVVFPAISFVLYLGTVAVWAVGGISVIKGEMSYGDLLTFVAYMGFVYNPLNYIVNSINRMGDCFNAAGRLLEITEAIPDVVESENPIRLENIKGDLEFKNVSFSYTKSKKTIDKVSFKLEGGKTLGIVGRTGAGKSTIVNLLMRLYDVNHGEILIDGVNIKDLSFKQLRDAVAIVSQETYLFSGTIYDNIAYAMEDATCDDVVKAAIDAGAHDFIMRLPDGYETRIGRGFKDLSGGERQRISIARALLKKPKILILDEATSAMDTATEQRIERAIETLQGSCTTLMIAHRLSTLKSADSLIVIEDGKLIEAGTHSELIAADGVYNRLYSLQLEALSNIIGDDDDFGESDTPEKPQYAKKRERG